MTETVKATIPALLLKVDGTWQDVELDADSQLHDFYRLIDCRAVGHIPLDDMPGGADMWHDDEFLINGSPANILATYVLFQYARSIGAELNQWIHGDVVITGSDVDGDTQELQQITRQWLGSYLPPQ